MDQNRKEELLSLWMDDALDEEARQELDSHLAKNPGLEREREEYLRLRDELRAVLPAHVEPPYPDFFNTHLERLIREEEAAEVAQVGRANTKGLWPRMRLWLAPGMAAAVAVVVAFLAGMRVGAPAGGELVVRSASMVPAVYSPISTVNVRAWEDQEVGVTVIVLDGLEEIPSSVDLLQTTVGVEGGAANGEVF